MLRFDNVLSSAKRRNPQAMMELYNICASAAYNASLHIVMNEFDAEEIMQDSVLKAFDNLDRFSGSEKDFVAFVKRIAVNKSIDLYRKHNKDPFFTEVDQETESLLDDEEELTFSIEMIKERIDKLPDGYKMVLNLHLIDGLDFAEIAEMMNIKASSVRSQYVRAKEKLKKELMSLNRI